MRKKLLNVILILAMIFNLLTPAGAVQTAPKAVLNMTAPKTALRGQEVSVAISLDVAANEVGGLSAYLEYSDGFPEIIGSEITTDTIRPQVSFSDPYMAIMDQNCFMVVGSSVPDGGQILGQISFKIPENADFGTVYTISFGEIIVGDAEGNDIPASEYSITNSFASVEVVDLPPVEGISVEEYQGVYDGDEHTIFVNIPDGASIQYSADGSLYEDEIPKFVNAGEYTVYYVVSKEGNSNTYGQGKVNIAQKNIESHMIDPVSPQKYTGSQITPSVTVTDGSPSIIAPEDYTVSYDENINILSGGSVTVTGKNDGNYTGSATVYFDILPDTMIVVEEDYEDVYDGQMHTASVSVTKPSAATVKYGEEEGVYNLDSMPLYKDAGTYTIYYKASAENYEDYTGSVKVIVKQKQLTDDMIADIESYDYTGSKITPSVVVTDENPSIITENDYTVSYGENINVLTGGSVTITGKSDGNYKGTAQKTFTIKPIEMDVTSTDYNGEYDGQEHSATLNVSIIGDPEISYGTVEGTYSETVNPKFKNVGINTVYYKIENPNYITKTGTMQVEITPKTLENFMVADVPDMSYTGEKIEPTVIVTDGNPSIITENDYTVGYGENINVLTGGSVTIEGKGNYIGNVEKHFNITPIPMTVSTSDYEEVYDGQMHTASVSVTKPSAAVVKYGVEEGVYNLDSMPEYKDVGTYTIYYKATAENYIDNTGSVKVIINQKQLTADMIADIAPYAYTGSQIIPEFSVADGSPSIITENDYTVSYGENINVLTGGSVTITGKSDGNYTGSATKNFSITPIDMVVSASGYDGIYDGVNHTVSVNVTQPATAQVMYGTTLGTYDLSVAPEYKNKGNYTVYYKITDNNYNEVTGELTVNISPKALTPEMLENITAQEFTGEQIKPEVVLRDTLPCEITENDYIVSYGPNISVAEGGSVTVEGKGNYSGSITKEFEIANAVLRATEQDYEGVYDGQAHGASVTITNCDYAQVMYGLSDGVYDLSEMPQYTNAGSYVVYYKATAENYSNCTGSLDVVITPKPLNEAMVANIAPHTYTAAQITPSVEVADDATITTDDYDITYGTNITVAEGGSVTVEGKRNYVGTVTKNFEILKADLNVTSENVEITYGDEFTVPVNYSGFVGSETKDVLVSEAVATGFDASPDAGVYDMILSGAEADNYNIIYGTDYTLTVNKKTISVVTLNVFDKAYDGTNEAIINETSAVLSGVLSGDIVMLDSSQASAEFASSEVGDGITVNIIGLDVIGEESGNYVLDSDTFTTTASIKATITAADLAAQITNIVIDRNATTLVLPTVPEGFTVTLKSSSDETIIDLQGVIYTGDTDLTVDLVFTVTSEDGTDSADTASITVTVPEHILYQVVLSTQGNGSVSGDGMYVKNTSATIVATADRGYKFAGWYNGDTLVSSSDSYTFTVTEDLNLVAKFNEVVISSGGGGITKYTVNFVANGGKEVKPISVRKGQKINALPVPVKDGYTFVGWCTDKELKTLFDADTAITKPITLYAKWEEKAVEPEIEPEKPENNEEIEITFADVKKSEWYYDAVKYVVEKGLFNGVSETDFAPNSPLTRAMLVTVLYRAEEQPEIESKKVFSDVAEGEYYSDAVIWAFENGIVSGVSETEFMPDNNITREQIAAIIYRYAKFKGLDTTVATEAEYADKDMISSWAGDAVAFLRSANIMTGTPENKFIPRANATRAEAAATLQRFFETK